MKWRKNIDQGIKNHLELQIREASKYKRAYDKAENPSNAQLWCAVANLSRNINQLNSKIIQLEKELYETKLPKEKKQLKKAADLIESINQL